MLEINYRQFPKKGGGNDFGTAISKDSGNGGDRIKLPEKQETNAEEKALRNVDRWGEDVIMGDFEEVVGEERLELRGDQIQTVRNKKWAKTERF